MNMKKAMTLGVITMLIGCSNGVINEGVYIDDGLAYNVATDRSVSGVVSNKRGQGTEYLTYKRGRLVNKKVVDKDARLAEESSYDSMGLLHGRSKAGEGYSNYYHGVLTGERRAGNYNRSLMNYMDGVLHGKQEIDGKISYYDRGVETTEDPGRSEVVNKRIKWGENPEENYSGELYSRPTIDKFIPVYQRDKMLEVRGYEKGILRYVRYYSENGEKVSEYTFYKGDIERIASYSNYTGGRLAITMNYNAHGDLQGETIEQAGRRLTIVNNTDGILHGETVDRSFYYDEINTRGIYKLGIFSGEMDGKYYLDGIESSQLLQEEDTPLELGEASQVKKTSGFIKIKDGDYNIIESYSDGKLVKLYKFYVNNLEKVRTPLEDGSYIEEAYSRGLLKSRYHYNASGEAEGEFLIIEHTGSKTVGNMRDGKLTGESKHYHGDTIYYIDDYSEDGKSYKRSVYYDYEEGKVSMETRGVYVDGQWIQVGKSYEYYEDGSVKRVADFGKEATTEKDVHYKEYYADGILGKEYTMNYSGYKFQGSYDSYSEKGNLISRWLYDDDGNKVNVKEYDEKGELIRDTTYDEYGREVYQS